MASRRDLGAWAGIGAMLFAVGGVACGSSSGADDAGLDDASALDAAPASDASVDVSPPDADSDADADAATSSCSAVDTFDTPVLVGPIQSLDIWEASGLAASRKNPGVFYLENDSGHPAEIFAIHNDASFIGKFTITGATSIDWEDVAAGPCPSGSCVFIGDTGDNSVSRKSYTIYRVPEPDIAGGTTSGSLTPAAFSFVYPDGKSHNCETLMVHPTTGNIYVADKKGGSSDLFELPATAKPGSTTTLTKVGHVDLNSGELATGGAIHPCANRLLLRTYSRVLELRAADTAAFEDVFTATPTVLTPPTGEGQGEAIEYATDGHGFYTTSEVAKGKMPPLHFAQGH